MKRLVASIFLAAILAVAQPAAAQCSMCTANAEMGSKNGNTQTKGINSGVLYLLSIPFLLAGGVGLLWYTQFRTSKV